MPTGAVKWFGEREGGENLRTGKAKAVNLQMLVETVGGE